jgi:hypothetical protein
VRENLFGKVDDAKLDPDSKKGCRVEVRVQSWVKFRGRKAENKILKDMTGYT